MKRFLLICCGIATSVLFAQNLVPNPSFETMTSIPSSYGQITNATPWYSNYGSSDLFHTASATASIPTNYFGTQAARTGNAYAGIAISSTNTYHEYIGVPLISPMVANQAYYCEAYISAGEGGYHYATDNFGFKFTVGAAPASGGNPPISGPSVNWPFVVLDYTNWVQISWTYTPTIAYNHLSIGNFFATTATTWTLIPASGSVNSMYWFIEDVVVQPSTVFAIGVNKIFAHPLGMEKIAIEWELPADNDIADFDLMRSDDNGDSWRKIDDISTSNGVLKYSSVDQPKIWDQELQYRLRQVSHDGTVTYSEIATATLAFPTLDVSLSIAPNPIGVGANGVISFVMKNEGEVNWEIYDLNGQRVAKGNEFRSVGNANVTLPSAEFAAGNYFLKFVAGNEAVVRRFVVRS